MICPSSSNIADPVLTGIGDITKQENFSNINALSYSIQDAYAQTSANFTWNNTIDGDVAIAADMNPGKNGSVSDVSAVFTNSTQAITAEGNSMNHKQDGQNVLYADNHVAWQGTCMCGHNNDNIYGESASAIGDNPQSTNCNLPSTTSTPKSKDDSVLLPTSPGTGGGAFTQN